MAFLDRIIGAVSPRAAFERQAWRQAAEHLRGEGSRAYAAADRGRRTADWRAGFGSGDAELFSDLATLRARSRQLARDNPYVASALRHLTANIVGTGIELRAVHAEPGIAATAKGAFDTWANEPVDVEERHDFYGEQKQAVRSMVEGGETLIGWRPRDNAPNGEMQLIEGDQIDSTRNTPLDNGGRIVAGIEYDAAGKRVAVWLWDHHPGDQLAYLGVSSRRHPIADYDHMFEAVRISGQARGVPWFHAGLRDVRELDGLEESIRIKKRVEACLRCSARSPTAARPRPSPNARRRRRGRTGRPCARAWWSPASPARKSRSSTRARSATATASCASS
jgi:capsid protein